VVFLGSYCKLDNSTDTSTSYSVTDSILSRAATSICTSMFSSISSLCPHNRSQYLQYYETTCIYDGAAMLTYQLNQMAPSISFSSFSSFATSIDNLGLSTQTLLTQNIFSVMTASIKSGLASCFFSNLTFNATKPEFDANLFTSDILPPCTSYCIYPGASCSPSGECQFSLTFSALSKLGSASCREYSSMGMFIILCISLFLSIW